MSIKKSDAGTLQIDPLKQGRVTLRMIGTTGFFFNAMSAKAKRTKNSRRTTGSVIRHTGNDYERVFAKKPWSKSRKRRACDKP